MQAIRDAEGIEWVPTQEAARVAGRTSDTIREWVKNGTLTRSKETVYPSGARRLYVDLTEVRLLIFRPGPEPKRTKEEKARLKAFDEFRPGKAKNARRSTSPAP
jgi:hypothetical protein